MIKKRFLSILALLCLTVSGAWAGAEPPLITIESKDYTSFKSGSQTFDNIATVTFSGTVDNDGNDWGWYTEEERTLTVTAAEGYTITGVRFYADSNSRFVFEAPFQAILGYDDDNGVHFAKVNGTSIGTGDAGVTKIEVFGHANPALNLTSPAVGQVIGDDGKNYDYASLPGGVTAVAKICYVSGSNGLALALADEGQMSWSTAMTTAAAHTPAFTGGTWKLATKDEWNNMITAAGSYTDLRDGFSGISGASNLQEGNYWSGTEYGASYALLYNFGSGSWSDNEKGTDDVRVRACLAFEAQGSDPEPTYTVSLKEGTDDAAKWQGKAGTGEYQALPLTGLEAGTAVTVKYNGRKRVTGVKAVKKGGALGVPLTMEALTDGTIDVLIMDVGGARRYDFLDDYPESSKRVPVRRGSSDINRKYSVNNGEKTLIDMGTTTIEVKAGDKVQFYGNGVYGGDIMVVLHGTAQTKVYGNIMSMIDETGYATLTTLQDQPGAFMATFYMNANLTDASGLLLPATTLANGCYWGMFQGCTSLTAAPELPATELAEGCYSGMFQGCTSLTTAPALPVTELAEECYSEMFYGCTSLTTAPTLPATELATRCYNYMFKGCSNLNSITCLATEGINENESTYNWLQGVASTGTFNRASGVTWPEGDNGIPSGWTVNEQ